MKKGDKGYWEWRKNVGKPRKLKSPEELWGHACEYFINVDSKPYMKQELIKGGKLAGQTGEVETMMPYTWEGLEDYLFQEGVLTDLDAYRYNLRGSYTEYVGIVRAITKVIYERNFSGAAVNALSTNLIARYLGLAEKTLAVNTELTGEIDYSKFSDELLEELSQHTEILGDDKKAK